MTEQYDFDSFAPRLAVLPGRAPLTYMRWLPRATKGDRDES